MVSDVGWFLALVLGAAWFAWVSGFRRAERGPRSAQPQVSVSPQGVAQGRAAPRSARPAHVPSVRQPVPGSSSGRARRPVEVLRQRPGQPPGHGSAVGQPWWPTPPARPAVVTATAPPSPVAAAGSASQSASLSVSAASAARAPTSSRRETKVSNDWPFSVTSKFTVDTGAEHLVTIRAATAADMRSRLVEASTIFPYASLITALEQETAQVQPVVAALDHLDYPGRPPGCDQPAPTNGNGNGNGHHSPVATTEADLTQRAHQRSAQASAARKATLPHLCPEHGRARQSRWGGYHCPTKLPDGSYCTWNWKPADASQVAAAAQVHPRDEN